MTAFMQFTFVKRGFGTYVNALPRRHLSHDDKLQLLVLVHHHPHSHQAQRKVVGVISPLVYPALTVEEPRVVYLKACRAQTLDRQGAQVFLRRRKPARLHLTVTYRKQRPVLRILPAVCLTFDV